MKKEIFNAIRVQLPKRSYRTSSSNPERAIRKRRPIHTSPPTEHVTVNAFTVFSQVLSALRTLTPIDRDRVLEAVKSELGRPAPQFAPASEIAAAPLPVAHSEEREPTPETEVIQTGIKGRMEEMLEVPEAAQVAGISKIALYGAIARGRVKGDKSSGRVMVSRAEAIAYKARSRPSKKKS